MEMSLRGALYVIACGWQCFIAVSGTAAAASELEIRLVNGSRPSEGRVEIMYQGRWATVCGKLWFGTNDVRVICRMLGYSDDSSQPVVRRNGYYGRGTGPVLTSVSCGEDEPSLLHCQRKGIRQCSHDDDFGVDCQPPYVDNPRIRLANGPRPSAGRVELQIVPGVWETVHGGCFDTDAAMVVCRMLNYSLSNSQPIVRGRGYYGRGEGPILLDDVDCEGNETSLLHCWHEGLGVTYNRSHKDDVGVDCQPPYGPSAATVSGEALHVVRNSEFVWVNLTCRAENFKSDMPVPILYSWDRLCTFEQSQDYASMCLFTVTRQDNGREVKCTATNAVDATLYKEAFYRINLVYGPSKTSMTRTWHGEENGPDVLTLTCTADDVKPSVIFHWDGVDGDDVITSAWNSSACTFTPTSEHIKKQIFCKASNADDSSLFSVTEVPVFTSHPEVTSLVLLGQPDTLVSAGQPVVLRCRAVRSPGISLRVFRADNSEELIVQTPLTEGEVIVTQTFTLTRSARCEDAGDYSCEANTANGTDVKTITFYVNCAPRLAETNGTHEPGTEDNPVRITIGGPPVTFHLVAYPVPQPQRTVFLGRVLAVNTSISVTQEAGNSTDNLVSCRRSDVIHRCACIFKDVTADEGYYAVTLGNACGNVTVFLHFLPDPREDNVAKSGPTNNSTAITYASVGFAVSAALVLIVLRLAKIRRYLVRKTYARIHRGQEPEAAFYNQLGEAIALGDHRNNAHDNGNSNNNDDESSDGDSENPYNLVDESRLNHSSESLSAVSLQHNARRAPSWQSITFVKTPQIPLPPLPLDAERPPVFCRRRLVPVRTPASSTHSLLADGTVAPYAVRRFSLPDEPVLPNTNTSTPDYLELVSSDTNIKMSQVSDKLHPLAAAPTARRLSLPSDYLHPVPSNTASRPPPPSECPHPVPANIPIPSARASRTLPIASLAYCRRSFSADYLHAIPTVSDIRLQFVKPSDYVQRMVSLAHRRLPLPDDYLHPVNSREEAHHLRNQSSDYVQRVISLAE